MNTKLRTFIRMSLLYLALMIFGFAVGILIRTQYFGDDLIWIWNT